MEILPLEHLILEQLYEKGSVDLLRRTNHEKKSTPLYKRNVSFPKFRYGFVVDLVNDPTKYDYLEPFKDLSEIDLKEDDIDVSKYGYWDISFALDVLAFNKDIIDSSPDAMGSSYERYITLTPEGVISYRNKKYIEKELEAISLRRKRSIEQTEAFLKKYWIHIAVAAYLVPKIFDTMIELLIFVFKKLWMVYFNSIS